MSTGNKETVNIELNRNDFVKKLQLVLETTQCCLWLTLNLGDHVCEQCGGAALVEAVARHSPHRGICALREVDWGFGEASHSVETEQRDGLRQKKLLARTRNRPCHGHIFQNPSEKQITGTLQFVSTLSTLPSVQPHRTTPSLPAE